MEQLTITRRPELTAGRRLLMVRTGRQRAGQRITHIPAPLRVARRCRHHMEAEARRRPIIRTRELMLRPDKVRARQLSGAAHTCRKETRAPTHSITQLQTEQLRRPKGRKAEKPPVPVLPGGTLRSAKPPAAIRMPGTMVMFTRTPVMVGRSTTTEVGIRWTSLRLRPIGAGQKTRSSGPAPETLMLIEQARAVTIEAARKQAAQVVAAATIDPAEVHPPRCKACNARLRIGSGVDRRASVSKTFSGAAVIASVAAEAGAVAAEAEAGSGVDDNN
jgi:hypothetical protein